MFHPMQMKYLLFFMMLKPQVNVCLLNDTSSTILAIVDENKTRYNFLVTKGASGCAE